VVTATTSHSAMTHALSCSRLTRRLSHSASHIAVACYSQQHHNKAVTDRRRRPGVATREVTLSARKIVPCVRWYYWYYCVVYSQAQGCVYALRFSCAATSSNLGLRANMTSSIKPDVNNTSLRRQRRTEPRPYVTCKTLLKIGRVIPKI